MNNIFLNVLDYLHRHKNVRDQHQLAANIGISPTSLSRIITGKNYPSNETLRKLNEAFGNIFNMDYLRGKDPYHMLISNLATAYSGNLFSNMNAFTISLNDTWLSDEVLTW